MRAAIGRGVALATAIFGLVGLSAGLTAAVEPLVSLGPQAARQARSGSAMMRGMMSSGSLF